MALPSCVRSLSRAQPSHSCSGKPIPSKKLFQIMSLSFSYRWIVRFHCWRPGRLHTCACYWCFAVCTVALVPNTTQPCAFSSLRVLKLRFSTLPTKTYVPSFTNLEPIDTGICLTCLGRESPARKHAQTSPLPPFLHVKIVSRQMRAATIFIRKRKEIKSRGTLH